MWLQVVPHELIVSNMHDETSVAETRSVNTFPGKNVDVSFLP